MLTNKGKVGASDAILDYRTGLAVGVAVQLGMLEIYSVIMIAEPFMPGSFFGRSTRLWLASLKLILGISNDSLVMSAWQP